jgi:hypothetical protein
MVYRTLNCDKMGKTNKKGTEQNKGYFVRNTTRKSGISFYFILFDIGRYLFCSIDTVSIYGIM